ncbi:hypothetical protein V6N13_036254 [Hibiscus sabdariffa]|uniref:Uncharacterized protein n=1 Tax=Hibiscus sabdariffa TaxID=183260 RepID=A0ABR2S6W8_9ROSI
MLELLIELYSLLKNAAYLASNPEKKWEASRNAAGKAEVTPPMVTGQKATVIEHYSDKNSSGHSAVSIMEQGHGKHGSVGISVAKTRGAPS